MSDTPMPSNDADDEEPGLPRSLKIFVGVFGVLVIAFLVLHLSGRGLHGH